MTNLENYTNELDKEVRLFIEKEALSYDPSFKESDYFLSYGTCLYITFTCKNSKKRLVNYLNKKANIFKDIKIEYRYSGPIIIDLT